MGKPAVTALGKVRAEAEFIAQPEREPAISFTEWLDEGIGHAVERGGPLWRERFLRAGPQAFLYRAPRKAQAKSVLLGVLSPSEDQFARPFPFGVVTELREAAYSGNARSLPVASERFVAAAVQVCRAAQGTARGAEILTQAEALEGPGFEEHGEAAADFSAWQEEDGVVGALWPLLFSSGAAGAEQCFRQLVDLAIPMRTHGGIGTCRAVRLPLGGGGAAAASFWLAVVGALGRWNGTIPAAFWPAEGSTGVVVIQFGEVPASSFGELWSGGGGDPLVVDLGRPERQTEPEVSPLSGIIGRVVADPRARVRALLDALGAF